jgi:hypothetical protein
MSAAEKARNDSVRILPSAPRLKLSDMAEDSSGASTSHSVIPPLRPENVLHSHPKRLRQFLEGFCPFRRFLSVSDSLIGELRKNDISYHGHPPWLGPCATWHEEVVLCLPQQLHCSIDLCHCCSRHAWPEGCTSARSALLPSPIFRPWTSLHVATCWLTFPQSSDRSISYSGRLIDEAVASVRLEECLRKSAQYPTLVPP